MWGLQNKRSNEINQRLTNRHLAASRESCCQQREIITKLVDTKDHFETDDSESTKKCGIVKLMKER